LKESIEELQKKYKQSVSKREQEIELLKSEQEKLRRHSSKKDEQIEKLKQDLAAGDSSLQESLSQKEEQVKAKS